MTARFDTGLVVGKFAPLHRGHELVIERALGECRRVLVLSWSRPELPGCGPELRAAWLARRFPRAESLVLTDEFLRVLAPPAEFAGLPANDADVRLLRRFTAWICQAAWGAQPDAIFTSEPDGEAFAAELAAWSGREVAAVLVDPGRALAPISGTELRADVHRHRAWLAPAVYRDFVGRVALVGGESSGKSELARALASRLGTAHAAEYGRELWEARAGQLRFEDLVRIAELQIAREESAAGTAREWLFCDTTPLTTLFYSLDMFGRADPALEVLAGRRYDVVVLCQPDFPFVQDGTRRDEAFRRRQHEWYVAELARRRIEWVAAAGPIEERIATVSSALSGAGSC